MAELIFHLALGRSSTNECNYRGTFYLMLPHKGAATAVWLKDFPPDAIIDLWLPENHSPNDQLHVN